MSHSIDTSAVLLPPPMAAGLTLLVGRTLGLSGPRDADAVIAALFGGVPPAFGQVRRLTEADIRRACRQAKIGDDALPVTSLRELVELMARIAPDTPACGTCGELPFSNTGGKISALDAGSICPSCGKGTIARIPMKLRKVAWTDGRLVEPQTTHDLRSRSGESIPLDDDGIVPWIGGWMHLGLERSLKEAGVPVYGFLAYMRLVRGAFDAPADCAALLQDPGAHGLSDRAAIDAAVAAAGEFLADREPTNAPPRPRFRFLGSADADALARIDVAGRTYLVEGVVGRGDKADVYRGAWDHPLTERVIIKVCRDPASAPLMAREAAMLASLRHSKANGTPFFVGLLPEIIATDPSAGRSGAPVTVFRYKNRYDWTLDDVIREYPDGVEPETMVWMWNRTLTLLAWLQLNRLTHGAIVPGHVLIHPANHGATLLDWAYAVRTGKVVEHAEAGHAAFQPDEVLRKEAATPETDIAMSARCMIAVLGGDPASGDLPASVPGPIADVLRVHARYGKGDKGRRIADALALEKEFGRIAESVYGPRRYHPFRLPRRSR